MLRWATGRRDDAWFSVLTIGEIRRGIELKRRGDAIAAGHLDRWLATLEAAFSSRILPVDRRVADAWARLNVPDPRPTIDTFIAATAIVHRLTLVTRNVRDVEGTGVSVFNPF